MHVNVQNCTRTTLPLRAIAVSGGELIHAVALPSAASSLPVAEVSIGCSGCCQVRNIVNLPVVSATAVALRKVRRSESGMKDIGDDGYRGAEDTEQASLKGQLLSIFYHGGHGGRGGEHIFPLFLRVLCG